MDRTHTLLSQSATDIKKLTHQGSDEITRVFGPVLSIYDTVGHSCANALSDTIKGWEDAGDHLPSGPLKGLTRLKKAQEWLNEYMPRRAMGGT